MQFYIANMECDGCARGVSQTIRSVDPQAIVQADPPTHRVTVQSDQPHATFLPALETAGFPATPI